MKLDRNSVIGFVLLAVLFFGYFYFTRQGQIELEKKQKATQDSLAKLPRRNDTSNAPVITQIPDSNVQVPATGSLIQQGQGTEELKTLENDLVRIVFSNKGGQPKIVDLKKYKSVDSSQVRMVDTSFDKLSYMINTGTNNTASIIDLYFSGGDVKSNPDGSQSISYRLGDSTGKSIEHVFTLSKDQYMVDWAVNLKGADKLFTQNALNLLWQTRAVQHEYDIKGEKRETQIGLLEGDGFDYFTMGDGLNKKFEEGVKWISLKQKFFNTTVIAESGFSYAEINCQVPHDSTQIVASAVTNLRSTIPVGSDIPLKYRIYYGPNDFKILKSYKNDMEDLVNLGQGFYAFVKYINRWIVLPVFNFFTKFVVSYGLVIALLTIFIRLLTSPLVYSSYLSGAKMKALRPEIDILKAKYKEDQQAFSMEQMKLFRTAGVNPLGGCIPALLQIPIFFALYSFFNSNIALRGEKFWWANDLSSYDAVIKWSYELPFIGSHISLFTILAVVTSLLISLYSMSMTPDQNNPVLKYMPYIFPVLLLGIFNSLPSALTWYYTVSNVITLILQFVIQNYIINHDKILAQLEENKKKPRTKPKWQERLEQMQETQKKVDQMKKNNQKK
ncbi:membrane protein insertase YidC [Pollutibacter soli]|uniref:membrane protein insertase YidC n=1 Tax=Pollutibacter soli TaxID=3034157 RepID=UPI0030141D32